MASSKTRTRVTVVQKGQPSRSFQPGGLPSFWATGSGDGASAVAPAHLQFVGLFPGSRVYIDGHDITELPGAGWVNGVIGDVYDIPVSPGTLNPDASVTGAVINGNLSTAPSRESAERRTYRGSVTLAPNLRVRITDDDLNDPATPLVPVRINRMPPNSGITLNGVGVDRNPGSQWRGSDYIVTLPGGTVLDSSNFRVSTPSGGVFTLRSPVTVPVTPVADGYQINWSSMVTAHSGGRLRITGLPARVQVYYAGNSISSSGTFPDMTTFVVDGVDPGPIDASTLQIAPTTADSPIAYRGPAQVLRDGGEVSVPYSSFAAIAPDFGMRGHGAVLGGGGGGRQSTALPTLGDNGSGSFGIPPPPPPQRQTGFNANTFGILGGGNAPAVSRIDIAGIPEGGRIWVDGIDLSLAPGASWNAAHTAYGVPVIVGAHSIEVVAPSGEKRGATATVGASTLTLPYASMTVTQAAPAGPTARREPVALDRSGVDAGFKLGNQQPPPAATGKGAIAVNNLPQQVTPSDLSAIREDGTSATFATTGTDGRFIASELAPGVWQIRVEEQHGITGSAVPAGSNVNNYVPPVVRSGTVTVTANATAELNFNDMVAVGGMVPHRDDNLAPPEQTSGAVPFSIVAPDTFSVTVDGMPMHDASRMVSNNTGMIGGYVRAASGAMTQWTAMLAPGTHRVSVRDASAAACYADTRDITVTAGVPASLDYSAPTAAALTACAARNGGATATGQSGGGWWSRRSEGEKVGMVALALTVLGGGAWYYAATRGASSAKKD